MKQNFEITKPGDDSLIGGLFPLGVFWAIYLGTCLIGSLIFLSGNEFFLLLSEYFAGIRIPEFKGTVLFNILLLLFIAPVLMSGGYVLGMIFTKKIRGRFPDFRFSETKFPWWIPQVLFYFLFGTALTQIISISDGLSLAAWTNYWTWLHLREQFFTQMGFFPFVSIYTIIPLTSLLCLFSIEKKTPLWVVLKWLPLPLSVILPFLIFQKKPVLVVIILLFVGMTVFRWFQGIQTKKIKIILIWGTGIMVLVYLSLLVAPLYNSSEKAISQLENVELQIDKLKREIELLKGEMMGDAKKRLRQLQIANKLGLVTNRKRAVFLYALMAPITRTSSSSLYYPFVFPEKHPYYGLDLGQDILGIGSMPDDNRVIWDAMYPGNTRGAVAAPFQFVLYSQVGMAGALAGSIIIGFLLSLLWGVVLHGLLPPAFGSLMAALVLLFSVYLALDSFRNSITVSYGVLWPAFWVVILFSLAAGYTWLTKRYFNNAE